MSPDPVTPTYSAWCDSSHSKGTWATAKCSSQLKLLRENHRNSSGGWPSSGVAFKGENIIWDKTLYVTPLWGDTGYGACHLAVSWPFRTSPLVLAWIAFIMPFVSWKNDTSGLPKKEWHLAFLLIKSSALVLCLIADSTFTWPPTEWQHVWRRIPFWVVCSININCWG